VSFRVLAAVLAEYWLKTQASPPVQAKLAQEKLTPPWEGRGKKPN
jgi:hypothetical protein